MTIEYRVKEVTRYIVTRYEADPDARVKSSGDVRQIGNEFASADTAYEVGCALARQEAELKGISPLDLRMVYPRHPREDDAREAIDPDPFNQKRPIIAA